MFKKLSIVVLFLFVIVGVNQTVMAHSDHDHPPQKRQQKEFSHHGKEKKHDHTNKVSKQDISVKKSVVKINTAMKKIELSLSTKKIDHIHDLTETIRKQIKVIESKTKKSSNQSNIKLASKRITTILMRLHKYADNNNINKSRHQFKRLQKTKKYLYSQLNLPKKLRVKTNKVFSSNKKSHDRKKGWHEDHDPKHGGHVFMSSNNYNHIEGVLVSMEEFRLYNYDDYTKPIDASTIKGSITVKYKKWYSENEATILFSAKKRRSYLVAKLPKDISFPIKIDATLTFPKSKFEERYMFEFEEISNGNLSKKPYN
jgi:hypothetical protein